MEEKDQYTRREFFRKRFGGLRKVLDNVNELQAIAPVESAKPNANAGASHPQVRVLRPPGAVEESEFLAGCTRCGECVIACPYHVIRRSTNPSNGLEGFPELDYTIASCMMCSDFPCIGACEPRVLRRDAGVKMGTARISTERCLSHQGSHCTECSDKCPVPNAIELPGGKPNVASSICTGCGVCQLVCLAPDNAVMIIPEMTRPNQA